MPNCTNSFTPNSILIIVITNKYNLKLWTDIYPSTSYYEHALEPGYYCWNKECREPGPKVCENPHQSDFDKFWKGYDIQGDNQCHNLEIDCATLGYDTCSADINTKCKDGSEPFRCPFDHMRVYCESGCATQKCDYDTQNSCETYNYNSICSKDAEGCWNPTACKTGFAKSVSACANGVPGDWSLGDTDDFGCGKCSCSSNCYDKISSSQIPANASPTWEVCSACNQSVQIISGFSCNQGYTISQDGKSCVAATCPSGYTKEEECKLSTGESAIKYGTLTNVNGLSCGECFTCNSGETLSLNDGTKSCRHVGVNIDGKGIYCCSDKPVSSCNCPDGWKIISGDVRLTESGNYCVDGKTTVSSGISGLDVVFRPCYDYQTDLTISGNFSSIKSSMYVKFPYGVGLVTGATFTRGARFDGPVTFSKPVQSGARVQFGGRVGGEKEIWSNLVTFIINDTAGYDNSPTPVTCVTADRTPFIQFEQAPHVSQFQFSGCINAECQKVDGSTGKMVDAYTCK